MYKLVSMNEKFIHKKSLGQNFLNSDYVPKKMCDAGDLKPGDLVLEIGPGTGVLTKEILTRGAKVIAVEADARAIASLEKDFSEAIARGDLVIHHGDARALDLTALDLKDHSFKVVANIPYYLSGFLLRNFLETDIQPTRLVFLMQKELVERIARDTKESLLSISVKVFGRPNYVATIKRGHFTPQPKVDSAILSITNISREYFTEIDVAVFFEILHVAFGNKRKQLVANLSKRFDRAAVLDILEKLNLPPTVRAEDIPVSTWNQLVLHLQSTGFSTN